VEVLLTIIRETSHVFVERDFQLHRKRILYVTKNDRTILLTEITLIQRKRKKLTVVNQEINFYHEKITNAKTQGKHIHEIMEFLHHS